MLVQDFQFPRYNMSWNFLKLIMLRFCLVFDTKPSFTSWSLQISLLVENFSGNVTAMLYDEYVHI